MSADGLRIALCVYRGNPHSGGQGVYSRYLSRELRALGHHVVLLSGPPYPELDEDIPLVQLPSLDLYRPDKPFRPHRMPRSRIDWLELAHFSTGAFPEPLTFSLRARRWLREHGDHFDVVHDNQCLGYGFISVARRLPLLATIHHPITVDRRLELERAKGYKNLTLRRWYTFLRMQKRVARKLPRLMTVSQTSRRDIIDELRVDPGRIDVVSVGVDAELFKPRPHIAQVPGRLLAVASTDVPLKGLHVLLEALAKLRTEAQDAHLVVIGRMRARDPARRTVTKFGLEGAVTFTGNIEADELMRLYAQAEVAVVPSLYEGFSLPAVQAMASGLALVCTKAGAIPEVAGRDGETALLVEPGDASALAGTLRRALEDAPLRARLAAAARRRVLERFTWAATAKGTAEQYRLAIEQFRGR
jgi:glycosyltransferase involved in cell wall biosynthesis